MRNRFLLLAMLLGAETGSAHHSRAHFDLDEFIEIAGEVSDVSWGSPHVYVEVRSEDAAGAPVTWTLEGHSIPGFQRVGWFQDSVEVGDQVLIVAHPNRQADKTFAMLYSATHEDGSTFYAYSIPEGERVIGAPDRAPTASSIDYSGTWRYLIPVREAALGSFRPPTEWPLTVAGRAQVEAFDLSQDPVLDCVPLGVPRLTLATYSHLWTRYPDRIVIDKERSPQVRTIHLSQSEVPDSVEPGELGYSIGLWQEDGALLVTTTHFSATRWGNARGLDSSAQKRVIERFALIDDGYGMSVEYTIDDPVYLSEPVTISGDYRKRADFEFVDEPCDPDLARRHLRF